MNISRKRAFQIVTDISEIINQHVNMMDDKGIIIASTNHNRIGVYHAAAHRIITERLRELVIFDDDEYEGTRKGINLPVMLNGDIAGVIGVTGEYQEVSKYSQIIKRMTEILLLENYYNEQQKLDNRIRQRFLDDWLFTDRSSYDLGFIERGQRMGIDVTLPRRVTVAEIAELNKYSDNLRGQRIIDSANKLVRKITEEIAGSVFTKTASLMICLVAEHTDERLRIFAEKIQAQVKKIHGIEVLIGIDRQERKLYQAYIKAKKALLAAKNFPRKICFYNAITLETFIDEISPGSKKEFIRHIFNRHTAGEIEKWINFLKIYFNNNGSVIHTAELLSIHKNTLQYQLKKLCEQTGRDPRNTADAALFYLAIQFYDGFKER
ncbi:MAG: helix-turn-helix domain-containing protein [Treponema sp.]|nr:helix-turn-helix domain-containing protein [Treponema sp.]